jgi:anti-sigma factor RsiW
MAYLETHARALVTGHLIDVVSSDRHTVKPWFRGRIDFAPPVPDLATQGFPLAGGRVDYVERRTMAVAVYQRRQHVIDVYIAPATADSRPAEPAATPPALGYQAYAWADTQWRFVAVADLDREELGQFVEAYRAALAH